MKKGTKVRVLKDNTVGTIADSMFFKIAGQKEIRYEVRKPGEKEGRWYRAIELGDIKENVKVTVHHESGQELYMNIIVNHDSNKMDVTLCGSPENLRIHSGLHTYIAKEFINNLKC